MKSYLKKEMNLLEIKLEVLLKKWQPEQYKR